MLGFTVSVGTGTRIHIYLAPHKTCSKFWPPCSAALTQLWNPDLVKRLQALKGKVMQIENQKPKRSVGRVLKK